MNNPSKERSTAHQHPAPLEAVLSQVREIARDVLVPAADAVDRKACWPEHGIRALQAAGLGGLVVPKENGGLGLGLQALVQACEILGNACSSTALCYGMHCVGSAVIAAKATTDQQQRYLEPISQGIHLTTLALSEPGTGVHFYFPQTRLEAVTPHAFKVTGVKSFITNGGHADSYVVSTVAAEPDAPLGRFSCVVVANEAEGIAWGAPWSGLGMRGNSSRTAELQGLIVPRRDLLGEEGDQLWYVFHVVAPYFLAAMAGTYLGVAGAALEEARTWLTQRHYAHSGSTLAQAPVLQHRLGSLWAMVERTRRLTYFAASETDTGGPDALPALCAAKAEVADCAVDVANAAMTLTGGINYRDGSRLERLLRDACAAHVMAPTTDLLRIWTGRALLGQPLLGE